MSFAFRLPDLGEGVAEGEILRWFVAAGEDVAEDQPLVEVQTDKTAVEIPSPVAGRVARIVVAEGEVVPVGTVLVEIGDGAAAAQEPPAAAPPAPAPARVRATPLVRRIAAELGVELASLSGSGPGGQITEQDVRGAAAAPAADGERREPLRGLRRAIADHLVRAQREVPAVTVVEECDFGPLAARRGERSYLPFVLEAVARVLPRHERVNATFEGDEVVLHRRIDLGVAVQTDRGLVVPVVRDLPSLSGERLDAELARLADGARTGTLAAGELRGSTFTVTSAGRLAGLFATPLVNHPEVAILGVHRISQRPVVRDGELAVGEVGLLSCTFDHRALDGVAASAFLLDLIDDLGS